MLLPYLRLAHCTDSESLKQASLDTCCSAPISAENELTVLHQLASHLQSCLSRWVSGPLPLRQADSAHAGTPEIYVHDVSNGPPCSEALSQLGMSL